MPNTLVILLWWVRRDYHHLCHVSGVAGAQLESGIILVLGLANLIADGFSMAAGAYLSLKSEQAYYDKEQERELWEVANFPEGEKQEMH